MAIHIEATGFNARAHEYEKGRPSYPAEAVARLREVLHIGPESTVIDVAAGTGKLTRLLVPTGARVIAVEPVEGMRHVLAEVVPTAQVLEGTAEDIPVPSAIADAVTVAQAFHWFRGDEALAEIHRTLVPGGGLGLVWNVRDLSQPLQTALEEVMARYRGGSPSERTQQWRQAFDQTELFSPLSHQRFAHEHVLDVEELVARALSTSFIARLPGAEQERVAAEVAALAPSSGQALMAYNTDVYWCEARAASAPAGPGPAGRLSRAI